MWEFWVRSLDASTIFLIAGVGELFGQRSGILNVGVEGVMLFGATLGFITAQATGSYLLGFVAAIAIGALLGILHGFFSITLGGDQVVSGMGIWILGFGLTTYMGSPFTGPLGMERIPTIFGLSPFFFIGLIFAAIIWFVLNRTSLGLQIRSVGENPAVAEVSGISVSKTRYLCVTVSGMLMGFAGAVYALDYNPVWSYNFLLGWGFIALALVFFSMWNPLILLGGSLLFGTMWQLSLSPELVLPGVLSRYVWRMVPFAITLIVLLFMSTKRFRTRWGAARPEALGQPYLKE
ncbi:MAG: ABC transporter permease [Ardenticatenaceae bacterium]|nr:ABC transporter permease [Anaerolineales bacterium]MCB8940730.1 ABC transporter permease [Ardenticatenaceae bacterium]MCB8972069.1 ABC transporter permease [Ardenticatenaceae bacterium]